MPFHDTPAGTAAIRRNLLQLLKLVPVDDMESRSDDELSTSIVAASHNGPAEKDAIGDIEAQAAQAGECDEKPPSLEEPCERGSDDVAPSPDTGTLPTHGEASTKVEAEEWGLNWPAMLVWHCPLMVIAYASAFYMAGLFCILAKPLIMKWKNWSSEEVPVGYYPGLVFVCTLISLVSLFAFCACYAPDRFKKRDDEREPDVN
ncbi:hypothetical protein B0T20DRAFT_397453 [Sordaria brevicollis]|uniref:Transmembrane protein n=1 Tax=Sordaria brevicollis TaxID=83679 RepID=A0AAE0NVI9_SORBR|nr:hypothetical protein B0T20DRAFT_397453 [Sordaria brevicollis]